MTRRLIGVILDPGQYRAVPVYQDTPGGPIEADAGGSWLTENRLKKELKPGWIYQRVVRSISPADLIRQQLADHEMDDERVEFEHLLEAVRVVVEGWKADPEAHELEAFLALLNPAMADLETRARRFGVELKAGVVDGEFAEVRSAEDHQR